MNRVQDIKEAIRQISGGNRGGNGLFLVGKVKSVEGETCTVDVAGLVLDEVRLTAVNDGTDGKLLLTPKADSMVLMADMSGGMLRDLAVIGYTHIEKGEASFDQIAIEADSIELNGGENGGLVNIEKLKEWMQNVESDIATLQALLKSSPIAGNGAPAAIAFTPKTKSVSAGIEDARITH